MNTFRILAAGLLIFGLVYSRPIFSFAEESAPEKQETIGFDEYAGAEEDLGTEEDMGMEENHSEEDIQMLRDAAKALVPVNPELAEKLEKYADQEAVEVSEDLEETGED